MEMNDNNITKDIEEALKWYSSLKAVEIAVAVQEGAATLTGVVESYGQKQAAVLITKSTIGVKSVTDKIKVKINTWIDPSDEAIAKYISESFKWNWDIPEETITCKVENGWVILYGNVSWHHQKEAAENIVSKLTGVKGISNNITFTLQSDLKINKKNIEEALRRNVYTSKEKIEVEVWGNRVTLTGVVNSLCQKEEAERVTINAIGVLRVDNQLVIEVS